MTPDKIVLREEPTYVDTPSQATDLTLVRPSGTGIVFTPPLRTPLPEDASSNPTEEYEPWKFLP